MAEAISILEALCLILTGLAIFFVYDQYPELGQIPLASPWVRTGLWLRLQELRGTEVTTIHDLHGRLGPIIRLSRNAVSVASDSPQLRSIHTRTQLARKSAAYGDLLITAHRPVFGLLDASEHAARRGGFGRTYSRTPDCLDNGDGSLFASLKSVQGHLVDPIDVFWRPVIQCNHELLFGTSQQWKSTMSFEQLREQRGGEAIGHGSPVERLRLISMLPTWMARRLRSRIARTYAARWVDRGCQFSATSNERDTPCSRVREHMRSEMGMAAAPSEQSPRQQKILEQRVRDEMIDQLTGGTDFPLSALKCALDLLAQPENQHWQDQIRGSGGEEKVAAVFNEVLRLYPPAAGSQPRELLQPITLPHGSGETTLSAGVIVHAQPFTLHRDEARFRDPESFRPERWLAGGEAKASDLWAFGKGPTHCIAQEYATKVCKAMLRSVCDIARFETETDAPALNASQGLLLAPPEDVRVRVHLRTSN